MAGRIALTAVPELTLRYVEFDPLGYQIWSKDKGFQIAGFATHDDLQLHLKARNAVDQRLFTNMVRSLFNIDGYLLPELTGKHQREFLRDPVRYFMGTDKAQQNAIFREVMKRQMLS